MSTRRADDHTDAALEGITRVDLDTFCARGIPAGSVVTATPVGGNRWRVVCTDTPGAPRATYLTWQQVTERIDVP